MGKQTSKDLEQTGPGKEPIGRRADRGTLLSERRTGAPTPHSQSMVALNSQIEFTIKWIAYRFTLPTVFYTVPASMSACGGFLFLHCDGTV